MVNLIGGGKLLSDPFASSHDSTGDANGLVEGGVCRLAGNLIVVGSLSSYSQAVHFWAIDTTRGEPTVGPETIYWSYDNPWATTPPLPDDPAINQYDTMNDFSFVIATGGRNFAMIGQPGETMPNGEYPIASFYTVDASLNIIRTAVCTIPVGPSDPFPHEVTGAAWGSSVVIGSDQSDYLWIAHPNGTVTTFNLTDQLGYTGGINAAVSAVAVTGNTAVLATFSPSDNNAMAYWKVDLNSGSVIGNGLMPNMGTDNWALFSTTLPDGRIAYTCTGRYDERYSGSSAPVFVGILNPATGSFSRVQIPGAVANYRGWTGGWYSNIRSVTTDSNGNIVVGWIQSNWQPMYAVVTPQLQVVDQYQFTARSNPIPSHNAFFYQLVNTNRGIMGLWCCPTGSDGFGPTLLYPISKRGWSVGEDLIRI